MSKQSHFEISVSKDGSHLFATHERSCVTRSQCRKVYDEIAARFPESQGFKITVTDWQTKGTWVLFDSNTGEQA